MKRGRVTLREVREAIEGKPGFSLRQNDAGLWVADYNYQAPDMFQTPIERECRGIKFDEAGECVARPYHKFFNYEEPLCDGVDWDSPHVVLEKLDGSLVHPVVLRDKMHWMTRAGTTDIAVQAVQEALTSRHTALAMAYTQKGLTPLFEYISPRNRIVVQYDKPQLVLTGMRYGHGVYVSYGHLLELGQEFGVPVVRTLELDTSQPEEFLQRVKDMKGEEGVVVRWDNGTMVKIKASEYVDMHRTKSYFESPKYIIPALMESKLDDIVPLLSKADLAKLLKYNDNFFAAIGRAEAMVNQLAAYWGDPARFGREAASEYPAVIRVAVFNKLRHSKEPYETFRQLAAKHCTTNKGADQFCRELGAPIWQL